MGAIATATDHQSGTLHNRLIRMPIRKTTKDPWISAAYRPKKIFAMGRIVSQAGQGHETPKTRASLRVVGTIAAVPNGGVMIDLTPMSAVRIDPVRRKAWVGGGSLLRNLDEAAQEHGLATTAGNVSHTGVGGLTLGGGMGWLARQFGLSCDNVEAYTVVTADGRVVRASESENPDLFWGLRGGGGNFGIVTEFEFRLHPIGGRALLGELDFDAADAPDAMRRWRDLLPDAPRAATLTASAVTAGDRPVVTLGFIWVGDVDDGLRSLSTIRELGPPAAERGRDR